MLLSDRRTKLASKDILSFILVKRDGQSKIVHGHKTIVLPDVQPYDPVNNGWNGGLRNSTETNRHFLDSTPDKPELRLRRVIGNSDLQIAGTVWSD